MVTEVLVSEDIAAGRKVIEALDKAKFPEDTLISDDSVMPAAHP
jgi:hypothetical protein